MLKTRHTCSDGFLKRHRIRTVPCDPHTKVSRCVSKSMQHLWLDQIIHFHLLVASFHTGSNNHFSFVWLSHYLPGRNDRRSAVKERTRCNHEWSRKIVLLNAVLERKVERRPGHIANHR